MQLIGAIRYDRGRLSNAQFTDEGYIRDNAVVTRTGIFEYKLADGSTRRELRTPENVFRPDSLTSLQMIPITNGHPTEPVNAQNAKKYSIGNTGENVSIDGDFIVAPIVITNKEGVDAVKNGRRELSLGYKTDLVKDEGIFNGERYDYIQTNIRYNHLAIVDVARAGQTARLNVDESDINKPINHLEGGRRMSLPIINIDGIGYEASQEVINALKNARVDAKAVQDNLDTANAEITKLKADGETAKGKADAQDAKITDLEKKTDGESIRNSVKARVVLMASAGKVLKVDALKKLDNADDVDIMKAVIIEKGKSSDGTENAELKTKLDSAKPEYIVARFDGVVEALDDVVDPNADSHTGGSNAMSQQRKDQNNTDNKGDDNKSARDKYIDRLRDDHKIKEPAKA